MRLVAKQFSAVLGIARDKFAQELDRGRGLNIEMSVVSLDSDADKSVFDGNEAATTQKKKQQVVLFDVDGQVFRTTPQTIGRYPGSLLHQLVLDYPEVVAAGEPLFVDRRPDYFPWILECYRFLLSLPFFGRRTSAFGV